MLLYLRLLKESFAFAMNALRNNKLRTMLSLLGVTIGIFSIIAVLAAVDSLDRKIKNDLSSLDKNTIYLTSQSFGPTEIPRWKREQFPNVTFEEYQYMKTALNHVENSCFQYFTVNQNITYESRTSEAVNMVAVTAEFVDVQRMEFSNGRFFNEAESYSGKQVVVLGYEIAQNLFDGFDPIGKVVRMYGQKFTVIGVTKKKGSSGIDIGGGDDTSVFFPSTFLRRIYGDNNPQVLPVIVIKPEKGTDIDALKGEISQKLRNFRGVKQGDIDNFFINILSGLTDMIDGLLGSMRVGGIIISFFSFLVGGFGIANIMFVSVKERTSLIGIQKSLGAKNRFILLQFLFEAIILCLIGGFIGLVIVWLLAMLLTSILDFEFVLGLSNIIIGTGLSVFVGLVSGILPAISASKLDPVEAIRSGM
ncbi:ABC transporter permease [Flavobacterium sp. J49]|uniref:ABC transporter permease n=1 Tax=Flavobacterium sp. J49 TaxID=2718534 RepID=UPI0015937E66|nr:ABC transporter permease [Flavobacterium sp. J49]MBF6641861.1 ABC transporter permease [Flavobacterium sp. J49]NIC03108.1 FtsX-like permease family protein [Flavobacterium sp. J49]